MAGVVEKEGDDGPLLQKGKEGGKEGAGGLMEQIAYRLPGHITGQGQLSLPL